MYKTDLEDRTLCYDGDSIVSPSTFLQYLELGLNTDSLTPTEITPEIKQYNALVSPKKRIKLKESLNTLSTDWNIPSDIDVCEHTMQCWLKHLDAYSYTDEEIEIREKRISEELATFKNCGLLDYLRCIIYVINTLHEHKVVWGVGRGSSVSSYVLFLIGVHDVDSVKYELDFTDFIR